MANVSVALIRDEKRADEIPEVGRKELQVCQDELEKERKGNGQLSSHIHVTTVSPDTASRRHRNLWFYQEMCVTALKKGTFCVTPGFILETWSQADDLF